MVRSRRRVRRERAALWDALAEGTATPADVRQLMDSSQPEPAGVEQLGCGGKLTLGSGATGAWSLMLAWGSSGR